METVTRHSTPDRDHRVPIVAFRNDLEETLRTVFGADWNEPVTLPGGDVYDDPMGYFEGFALEETVWRQDGNRDAFIVEWLLGCGGPTVRLTYDNRWANGTLMHSWGMDDWTGEDRHEIEVRGEICERLADLFGVSS